MGRLGRKMVGIKIDSNEKIEKEKQRLLITAGAKFSELAEDFKSKGFISRYSLDTPENQDTIISLLLYRYPDNKKVELCISSRGECFDASYDDIFHKGTSCSYDLPEKLDELNDLLDYAKLYIQDRHYLEESYSSNKKVIYRKLVFTKGSTGSSQAPLGYIRHFFCKKTITTPPPVSYSKS